MATSITWLRPAVVRAPVQEAPAKTEAHRRKPITEKEHDRILDLLDRGYNSKEISARVGRSESVIRSIRARARPNGRRSVGVITPAEHERILDLLATVPLPEAREQSGRGWECLCRLARQDDKDYSAARNRRPLRLAERQEIVALLRTKTVQQVQRDCGRSYETLCRLATQEIG